MFSKYDSGTGIGKGIPIPKGIKVGKKERMIDPNQVQNLRFENNLLWLDALPSNPAGVIVLPLGPTGVAGT